MFYCRLVNKLQDAQAIPNGDVFLVAIPRVGEFVHAGRRLRVDEVMYIGDQDFTTTNGGPPPEPQVLLKVSDV